MKSSTNPRTDAEKFGTDLNLLDRNLSLTYEQRIEQHERARDLLREILKTLTSMYGLEIQLVQGNPMTIHDLECIRDRINR